MRKNIKKLALYCFVIYLCIIIYKNENIRIDNGRRL